jgi:hypothetical protein
MLAIIELLFGAKTVIINHSGITIAKTIACIKDKSY